MQPMNPVPTTLRGQIVRLEPLSLEHVEALARVGLEPEIWRLSPTPMTSVDDMRTYVMTALDELRRGVAVPFVIVEQVTGHIVGSTRFANIDPVHHRLEIGWTWIAPPYQRTAVNTEAKLLLLTHAFEMLKAIRVELKTDALNDRSRAAILRIGAKEEGTFRNHMVTSSGRIRDSVYFSIIDTEWPAVKAGLQARLRPQ